MAAKREEEPLRQTIFLEVAEKLRQQKDSRFIADSLLGLCRVGPEDVLCVQSFGQGLYDLSFCDASVCAEALQRLRAAAGKHKALRGVHFCLGSARRRVPVTVHARDPFVSEGALAAFLRPYCERVGPGEKLSNGLGLWNGKRRFVVTLKLDDGGDARPGATLHPPAEFTIGACRATLAYPGQPSYCAVCSTTGHSKAECRKGICPHCGDRGHDPSRCQFRDYDPPWGEDLEDEGPAWADNSCGGRG